MVVQFQRGSDSSEMLLLLLLPLGVVVDIESAAAVPLLDAPAALSAGDDDRDGPPRPRSAAPLVRVRQHEVAGKDGKAKKEEKQLIEDARRERGRKARTFVFNQRRLLLSRVQVCPSLQLNSRCNAAKGRSGAPGSKENRR